MAEAIKASLKELGIEVETLPLEYMVWAQQTIGGDFDLSINTTNGLPYDPQNVINAVLANMSGEYTSIGALRTGRRCLPRAIKR